MPVKTNGAAFAGRMRALGSAVPGAEKTGVRAASKAVQEAILASARAKGAHPRSSWLAVEQRGSATPSEVVTLRGAKAYWAERGTKAHSIKPKRRKAIRTPQGPRAGADVRGVRAKRFWQQGVTSGAPKAAAAYRDSMVAALRSR